MTIKPISEPAALMDTASTALLKSEMRREMRAKRAALNPAQRAAASIAISRSVLERLLRLPKTMPVAIYLAKSEEVDVDAVARRLLQSGYHVVAPCHSTARLTVAPATGYHEGFAPLRFRPANDNTEHDDFVFDVRPGAFGVREPIAGAVSLVPPAMIGAFVLPGLAFDTAGCRLGYGGGWFDKALSGRAISEPVRPLLIGVCFDCQIVESVPREAHDVRMDLVITESRRIEIS